MRLARGGEGWDREEIFGEGTDYGSEKKKGEIEDREGEGSPSCSCPALATREGLGGS